MNTPSDNRDVTELAAAGADWWAGEFGNRSAAPKVGVGAIDAAASLLSEIPPPTADQVIAFRTHLAQALVIALTGSPNWLTVQTDYNADHILAGALEAAGLQADDGVLDLPWKTTMQFCDGEITVETPGKPIERI